MIESRPLTSLINIIPKANSCYKKIINSILPKYIFIYKSENT